MSNFNSITDFYNLQFYRDSASGKSQTIYCFKSEQSMEHFKKNQGKNIKRSIDGLVDGLPLFSCELKHDGSYFLSDNSTNYTIYKYVIIPSNSKHPDKKLLEEKYLRNSKKYSLIDVNAEYNVSVYKCVYCEVINKVAYFSFSKTKISILNFERESLHMTVPTHHAYISVSENANFEGNQWIFRNNEGNVFIDDFYINDRYKLVGKNGLIAAEFDYAKRSNRVLTTTLREKLCDLRFPVERNPPEYSKNEKIHNYMHDYLIKSHEEIVCMVFVIINYKRAEEKHSLNRNFQRNNLFTQSNNFAMNMAFSFALQNSFP